MFIPSTMVTCSPVIPALRRQNREDPGAHWPANLVEWVGEHQVQEDSVSLSGEVGEDT